MRDARRRLGGTAARTVNTGQQFDERTACRLLLVPEGADEGAADCLGGDAERGCGGLLLAAYAGYVVPTYPERTNLPQETLDFRRTGFSPALRYSCQHSLSYKVHNTLQYCFNPYTTLLYHTLSIRSFGNRF